MVWLSWNHPNMPWITTEAWVGEVEDDGMLRNARRVAGEADEALFQPEWSPDGDLYVVSDRGKRWWNLYRERDCALEPMAPREAEFGRPQWTFGMSTYAFESAERLICWDQRGKFGRVLCERNSFFRDARRMTSDPSPPVQIGLLASIPRFLRKGWGIMGFLKNNPKQSSRAYPILSDASVFPR